jgi:ribose transport system ATP-binding protein
MDKLILELHNISKSFPGVDALKGVNLRLRRNEVVGLVGENGAGKSTLMKILVGLYQADEGEIILNGNRIKIKSVKEAGQNGIGMVFQEQSLLDNISIASNIFLGNEEEFIRGGMLNWKKLNQEASRLMARFDMKLSPKTMVRDLSFSEKQIVGIARVIAISERCGRMPIIIFDEPTTVGSQSDIDRLFNIIRSIKEMGSVIFISHRLEEILQISDYIFIMKDGKNVADIPKINATIPDLHRLMVGRERSKEYYREAEQGTYKEEVILQLQNCSRNGNFKNVSLELHKGEILGICGVLGSGREVLCRAIAGILPFQSGNVFINGERVVLHSPLDAKARGIGYVPVDRRNEGLAQFLGIAPNITLASPELIVRNGWLSYKRENAIAREWMGRLEIKASNPLSLVSTLSGGNQQKVVLAKWLASGTRILILDHPTRGIDVGAKEEVYILIRELAKQGLSIILTSDALSELIGLSNRIIAMKDGCIESVIEAPAGKKPDEVEVVKFLV